MILSAFLHRAINELIQKSCNPQPVVVAEESTTILGTKTAPFLAFSKCGSVDPQRLKKKREPPEVPGIITNHKRHKSPNTTAPSAINHLSRRSRTKAGQLPPINSVGGSRWQ